MQPHPGASNMLAFADVARELAFQGIELFVVSTENRPPAMTDAWLAAHRQELLVTPAARKLEMPGYTLYLAELVREVGGSLYFLRELGSLGEIYHRIALTLGAEYVLGYYSSAGSAQLGWRALGRGAAPPATKCPLVRGLCHRGRLLRSPFLRKSSHSPSGVGRP